MNGSSSLHNHLEPWRILVFAALVLFAFGIFAIRLFTLQILQGPEWLAKAETNRTRTINSPSARGVIYDRNDIVLARNIASYNVVNTAADMPDDAGEVQEIFRQLSELIGLPVNLGEISEETPYVPCISEHDIAQIVEYGESAIPFQPVKVICDIDQTTAMIVQQKAVDWPGFGIEIQPIRDYPTGSLTASIIGFLGPIPAAQEEEFKAQGLEPNRDKVGYAGLELEQQDLLAGTNGARDIEVDVAGQELRTIGDPVAPEPGKNLRLTVDTRLQQAATAILERELNLWNTYLQEMAKGRNSRFTSGFIRTGSSRRRKP